jgi:hypothetical protein
LSTDFQRVKAKTGYWRVPNTSDIWFVKCLNPCACLGAPNPELVGCHEQVDPRVDYPETCNAEHGYRPRSVVCAGCSMNYTRDYEEGTCRPCAKGAMNVVLLVVEFCLFVMGLAFVVWVTVIKRQGTFRTSDGAKKIFISFLQLAALAAAMVSDRWRFSTLTFLSLTSVLFLSPHSPFHGLPRTRIFFGFNQSFRPWGKRNFLICTVPWRPSKSTYRSPLWSTTKRWRICACLYCWSRPRSSLGRPRVPVVHTPSPSAVQCAREPSFCSRI